VEIRAHKIIYEVFVKLKPWKACSNPSFQSYLEPRRVPPSCYRRGHRRRLLRDRRVLNRSAQIRVVRDGVVINTSKLSSQTFRTTPAKSAPASNAA
jgi:hypothetical protein